MKVEKIYLDMDGVLADFDRGLRELCGMDPAQGKNRREDIWGRVKSVGHFYDKLELMPGAKELFDAIYSEYGDRCEILTGVPKPDKGIPGAGEDKINWMRRMLSEDIKMNIVLREEKRNYCKGRGCILIDDLYDNIRVWDEYGGTGILHRSSEETLAELREMGVL
jgi:5'(3')-deoxyribonucleotidase